jgi:hypothetical protein
MSRTARLTDALRGRTNTVAAVADALRDRTNAIAAVGALAALAGLGSASAASLASGPATHHKETPGATAAAPRKASAVAFHSTEHQAAA